MYDGPFCTGNIFYTRKNKKYQNAAHKKSGLCVFENKEKLQNKSRQKGKLEQKRKNKYG